MEVENQLFLALGYVVFMLLVSYIFIKFPPKNINYFYGYRTRKSMLNEEIWKVANEYSARLMLKITLISLIFPPVLYFLYPELNLLVTIVIHTVLLLSTLYFTEKYLSKDFDKDGEQK